MDVNGSARYHIAQKNCRKFQPAKQGALHPTQPVEMFGNFSGARTNVTDRRQTDERAMAYGEREREFKFAKTNYILFHSKNKNIFNRPAISIDDDNVNQVNQIKFLGIIINKTLSWTDHITRVKSKVAKKNLWIISRVKKIFLCLF